MGMHREVAAISCREIHADSKGCEAYLRTGKCFDMFWSATPLVVLKSDLARSDFTSFTLFPISSSTLFIFQHVITKFKLISLTLISSFLPSLQLYLPCFSRYIQYCPFLWWTQLFVFVRNNSVFLISVFCTKKPFLSSNLIFHKDYLYLQR